jgi:hypothetical protein
MELAIMSDVSSYCLREVGPPLLCAHLGQVDADETKFFGQLTIVRQVVERGHDEALRQIAGCTKNYHRAGRRHGGASALLGYWLGTVIWPI